MKELFEALKKASLPAVWTQGVKLSRDGGVLLESRGDDQLVFRVKAPKQQTYNTITLYPDDREWTCDCPGPADPCQHVIAASISMHREIERGERVPGVTEVGAQLIYAISSVAPLEVKVERFVLVDGERTRLEGTLTAAATRFALNPGPGDVSADRILGAAVRGRLRPSVWRVLLEALSGTTVELDGEKVAVSDDPLNPEVRVYDDGDEVVLELDKDPRLARLVARGLGLIEATLRPLGRTDLSGTGLELLPLVRRFSLSELGELTGHVLPELEAELSVAIESPRVPRLSKVRVAPRLSFDVTHEHQGLSVLPLLVYGDPPRARVDANVLVHLRGEVPLRDLAEERRLLDRLRDELNLAPGRRVSFIGAEASKFVTRLRRFQARLGGELEEGLLRSQPLEPWVRTEGERLQVEFRLLPEAKTGREAEVVSAEAVLAAYRSGLDLVALQGGGFASLPVDWLSRFGDRVAALLAARDAQGRVARAAVFGFAALCEELGQPTPPSFEKLRPLIDAFETLPEASLPADLNATLRPYQRTGVNWLCFLRDAGLGAVLADDMGLGKTLQTLCALTGRTLIVCPKSVAHNWRAEARRFRPSLSVGFYQGAQRRLDPELDVTIVTYAVLRLDIAELAAVSWDTVVLDEAQAIKNPTSQVARAAHSLSAEFSVALSGTPLENRLEELWSILHFTHRGLLGGLQAFSDRYTAWPDEPGSAAAGAPTPERRAQVFAELRSRIKPFVLRRHKRDVLPDLPPRTDVVLRVELEENERAIYSAVHAATRKEVLSVLETGGNVLKALEALLRLRQAACHPSLLPGQSAETSSKVDALVEELEQVAGAGHRALVFSQWTSLLDLVEPHLDRAQISRTRLDGSTRDREKVVGEFQAEDGPTVLLCSLKAGGTGLNLTSADHVFLLDPWWNPAVEDQAADRAHRIGQVRPVMVYRLIASETVEDRILVLQDKKRSLAAAALEGAGDAAALSRDDLLALLS